MPALISLILVLAVLLVVIWAAWRRAWRADFIRSQGLPRGLFNKLRERHPQRSVKDCQLVAQALRQFFMAYLKGGRRPVSMASQVTDDLWHEFVLDTRAYGSFCRQAFGGMLHHTPAAAPGGTRRSNEGLPRCW